MSNLFHFGPLGLAVQDPSHQAGVVKFGAVIAVRQR
jgi:hypothetical protein